MYRSIQFMAVALAVLSLGTTAHAQGLVFADAYGHRIPLTQKSLGQFASPPSPTTILSAGNLQWSITYMDVNSNTNSGFDDPLSGAARQATAEAVLQYIQQVLNIDTNATIEVVFQHSGPNPDFGGYLAMAGSFWSFGDPQFDNGVAFRHIMSGTDPEPDIIDISCEVDFTTYPWNSDHTVSPTAAQFDLFSVLLHEMTHGLGLLSLADALGRGINGTNPDVYTHWDRLMRYGANTACWNEATTDLMVPASAFVSDNLFFGGANATAVYGSRPRVYAPAGFEEGSSLGHFRTGTANSVMEPAIANGEENREYDPVDVAALRDIGYTNAALPSVANVEVSGNEPYTEGQTLILTATPGSALAYQWYRNGQPIQDATENTLVFESATTANSGSYTCEITTATDGVVMTDPVAVVIHAAADVPAGGILTLSTLAATLLVFATKRTLRKRHPVTL